MRVLIDGQTFFTADINRGIGRYLLNTLKGLLRIQHEDTFLLLTGNGVIDLSVQPLEKVADRTPKGHLWKPIEYESALRNAIRSYDINLVWNPNPLMLNVCEPVVGVGLPTIATVYDLIPLKLPSIYLDCWSSELKGSYLRRVQKLRYFDRLLAISGTTQADLVCAGISSSKIRVTYLGVETPPPTLGDDLLADSIRKKFGIASKFLLYTGGFDPRKNQEALVRAFALLKKNAYSNLQLVIVCEADTANQQQFLRFVNDQGLSGSVILTGYVSDKELRALYGMTEVFVFPSLYEGFGLPVVEAMASGAAVAASKCASIPEIVDDSALLFDPTDVHDIANTIERLLNDRDLRRELQIRGRTRAARFEWDTTVRQTHAVMRDLANQARVVASASKAKLKVIYFSPLNPQPSGISDYSEELIRRLVAYADIDVVTNGIVPSNSFIRTNCKMKDLSDFMSLSQRSDDRVLLYHMGNNLLHDWIYDLLQQFKGVTVLHDYNLHGFIQYRASLRGTAEDYTREMEYCYGPEGKKVAEEVLAGQKQIDVFQYPLNKRVVESSKAIICHSLWVKEQLSSPNVHVLPMGAELDESRAKQLPPSCEQLIREDDFVVGCFGYLGSTKRLHVVLPAFIRLRARVPTAKLLLVGELYPDVQPLVAATVQDNEVGHSIVITGRVSMNDFLNYMRRVDVVVGLRYPTMGESSAAAMRALGMGKPLLVTNFAQFAELPDDVCLKMDLDDSEVEMVEETLFELFHNKEFRAALSGNARRFVRETCSWEIVARRYHDLLSCIQDGGQ